MGQLRVELSNGEIEVIPGEYTSDTAYEYILESEERGEYLEDLFIFTDDNGVNYVFEADCWCPDDYILNALEE